MNNYNGATMADTYVWEKALTEAKPVTVQYQNEAGDPIADDVVFNGYVGEHYVSEQKEIEGYTFDTVVGDVEGILTDTEQAIIYIYTLDPVEAMPITIKYQDETGKKIADDAAISGYVNDSYDASSFKKDITGYEYIRTEGNETGVFTDTLEEIIFVYQVVVDENNSGSEDKNKPDEANDIRDDSKESQTEDLVSNQQDEATKTADDTLSLPKAGEKSEIISLVLGGLSLIAFGQFMYRTSKNAMNK